MSTPPPMPPTPAPPKQKPMPKVQGAQLPARDISKGKTINYTLVKRG